MRPLASDMKGSTLVGFVLILPAILLVFFATVEFAMAMHVWSNAVKASHWAARTAVITDPVAKDMQFAAYKNGDWGMNIGTSCMTSAGAPIVDADGAQICPSLTSTCSGATSSCSGGYSFHQAAFDRILDRMRWADANLQPENVEIEYTTNGLGFVARPNGLPLTVTIRLRCVRYTWQFLQGFVDWLAPTDGCDGAASGLVFPPLTTTLTGESLCAFPAIADSTCLLP